LLVGFKPFHNFDFAPGKDFIKKKSHRRRRPGATDAVPSRLFSLAEAADNSPQFQLRVCIPKANQAPAGRKK
jgi:hypothetical protein